MCYSDDSLQCTDQKKKKKKKKKSKMAAVVKCFAVAGASWLACL